MPSQTWVARFVVDHGQVTEEGGRLRTFQRRRLDEPEIDLHILAEPTGPKADEFGAQALEAVGRDFVKDTLSLTGGLRRALLATNQVLLDWNRRSIAREQVGVGVVAAVVRGTVVYLAQAGPTLVFARRGGRLTRLVPQEGALVALGEGQIEPEIRRFEMEPGDVIIASSLAIESVPGRAAPLDEVGEVRAVVGAVQRAAVPALREPDPGPQVLAGLAGRDGRPEVRHLAAVPGGNTDRLCLVENASPATIRSPTGSGWIDRGSLLDPR